MAAFSIANPFTFFNTSKPPSQLQKTPPSQLSFSSDSKLALTSCSDNFPQLASPADGYLPYQPLSPCSTSTDDVMSVVCPSLAYANTLFFRSAYNVQVIVDENEPEEKLVNRFRREVMRAGVIQECKRRRFFENKQDEKKRRSREAAKRNRRRRPQLRGPMQNREEASKENKKEDDEDNWDLPEGELPY